MLGLLIHRHGNGERFDALGQDDAAGRQIRPGEIWHVERVLQYRRLSGRGALMENDIQIVATGRHGDTALNVQRLTRREGLRLEQSDILVEIGRRGGSVLLVLVLVLVVLVLVVLLLAVLVLPRLGG